ncbi:hypothetical protein FKW77_002001 [Venturia effusa]|uniref:Uncharacterized protein n=1 Tax=Venturia effusa TaxID=50376 RepID=A0A517LI66_9PEZI|nr:hypothetical protein FKW77_002001 [Venturia effusa]
MKTNNYLTLCREQADLSPLHYRHGCVIVRGGKVIGQGFNDLRAGFDGGALKHGRIASGALDGPAIMDLKRKRKLKPQSEPKCSVKTRSHSFTPYEAMGGGHRANVPLSMHSEMMAIHSAIARSGTLNATAVSSVKPSFKLPGGSKRKAKLRQEALKEYVKLVCCAALDQQQQQQQQQSGAKQSGVERREGEYSVQEWCFETSAFGSEQGNEKKKAHHMKKKEYQYQYQYQYKPSGQQKAHMPQSTFKDPAKVTKSLRDDDHKLDNKEQEHKTRLARAEPMLIPNGRNRQQTNKVIDRQRHSLLAGADLYVARFGSSNKRPGKQKQPVPCCDNPPGLFDEEPLSRTSTSTASSSPTGSLHDELLNPDPRPPTHISPSSSDSFDWSSVHASRPCYRCVSYMHSVGIKRVFWSNDEGQWEGAKVRDLVDALGSSASKLESGEDGGKKLLESGVFITKHEVLMMRRMMGNS